MATRTKKKPGEDPLVQFTFKIPTSLYGALQEAGRLLHLDLSNLLRMIVGEHIGEYIVRGKAAAEQLAQARARKGPEASSKDRVGPNPRSIDL